MDCEADPEPSLSAMALAADLDAGELLLVREQELSSARTHQCCHAVRLLFLFSHGLCVLVVSASLGDLSRASWGLLFLPLWIGDALCGAVLVRAWFASCPYIKLCLAERNVRVRENPSILTEIMPEIFLAVLGFLLLLLASCGEYALCAYLSSAQRGEPRGLPAAATLLGLAGTLAACHGALLTHNSPLYLLGGGGLVLTVLLFAATRGAAPAAQATVVAPTALAAAGLAAACLHRLRRHLRVLVREERALRAAEAALLLVLSAASWLLAARVAAGRLRAAGAEGSAAGATLCLLAALRARLCWWEAARGSLEDRLLEEAAEPGAAAAAREVQFGNLAGSASSSPTSTP